MKFHGFQISIEEIGQECSLWQKAGMYLQQVPEFPGHLSFFPQIIKWTSASTRVAMPLGLLSLLSPQESPLLFIANLLCTQHVRGKRTAAGALPHICPLLSVLFFKK